MLLFFDIAFTLTKLLIRYIYIIPCQYLTTSKKDGQNMFSL